MGSVNGPMINGFQNHWQSDYTFSHLNTSQSKLKFKIIRLLEILIKLIKFN